MVHAPFSQDQVDSLNEYQESCVFHPFTCECGAGDLIAHKDGWLCPKKCGYTQKWAHSFMANWAWKRVHDLSNNLRKKDEG